MVVTGIPDLLEPAKPPFEPPEPAGLLEPAQPIPLAPGALRLAPALSSACLVAASLELPPDADWAELAPLPPPLLLVVAGKPPSDGPLDPVIRPFDMHAGHPDVVVHLHGADSVTEEWTIQNYTLEFHAFHIHQVHFRDITAGRDPATAPLLDTVHVPFAARNGGAPGTPGQTRIRLTFTRAEIGEFVFHCHVLEHEDNGMMQTIRVVAD